MDRPKLSVIVASTRDGRQGRFVADWFLERATSHGKFEIELVDLKDVSLPMFDEPRHPRLRQYEHEHTKAWSARVASADTFVFVTPEYNNGAPPSLVNALDYLVVEWGYKAVGFVSYGGMAGGTRAVLMTKLIVTTLKMMPIPEAVAIPFFAKQIENGVFKGGETQEQAARVMLDELLRWTAALKALRS